MLGDISMHVAHVVHRPEQKWCSLVLALRWKDKICGMMLGQLVTGQCAYSYGHLLVITGYKWDYTFYKWRFVGTCSWYFGP